MLKEAESGMKSEKNILPAVFLFILGIMIIVGSIYAAQYSVEETIYQYYPFLGNVPVGTRTVYPFSILLPIGIILGIIFIIGAFVMSRSGGEHNE